MVPARTVADSIPADLTSSSLSLTTPCSSFASAADFSRPADVGSPALGADAEETPTALLIRCGHSGKKLARATPAARAPTRADRRAIMPLALMGHLDRAANQPSRGQIDLLYRYREMALNSLTAARVGLPRPCAAVSRQ